MTKILITGGSGTIGKAFIHNYYHNYEFVNISRNEKLQHELNSKYPKVKSYLASIEDKEKIFNIYDIERPDVVIHAAAIKHINLAEKQPRQTCNVNILGSLNIVNASINFRTPITIGISTDKACDSRSIYGVSKYLMERCFLEANSNESKFSICRFANVAHSNGSVIPYWLKLNNENKPLTITDPNMNRMIFSRQESSLLIKKCLNLANSGQSGLILSKLIKTVNIQELAFCISKNIEVVGARLGEKTDEVLISDEELVFSKIIEDNYIQLLQTATEENTRLKKAYTSSNAEKMSYEEMLKLIYG